MKYIKQLAIISLITFIGEFLSEALPYPVPGSVYGMLLLFFGLWLKVIKLEHVEETADFLLLIMPIFFVAPGVRIIGIYTAIRSSVPALVAISILTTIFTIFATGVTAQAIIEKKKKKEQKNEQEEGEQAV